MLIEKTVNILISVIYLQLYQSAIHAVINALRQMSFGNDTLILVSESTLFLIGITERQCNKLMITVISIVLQISKNSLIQN